MKFTNITFFVLLLACPGFKGGRFSLKGPKVKAGFSLLHLGFEGLNLGYTVKQWQEAWNDTLHTIPQEALRDAMAALGKQQIEMADFRSRMMEERDSKQLSIYILFGFDVLLFLATISTPFVFKRLKQK